MTQYGRKLCINVGNILDHQSVKSKIPPYFKDQSLPIILYSYTIPVASKFFNYKHVLHDLNIDDFKSVEDYARQWAKREKDDLDTLSE